MACDHPPLKIHDKALIHSFLAQARGDNEGAVVAEEMWRMLRPPHSHKCLRCPWVWECRWPNACERLTESVCHDCMRSGV